MFIQFDAVTVIDMNKVLYFKEIARGDGTVEVQFRLETRDADAFITVKSTLKEVASKISSCYTMEKEKETYEVL